MKFTELNLGNDLLEGIEAMGYDTMTPIQEQAIPAILEGRDLIASAQTGTGKTAAFLLPIVEKITQQDSSNRIKALVIVPTRELAVQIQQNMEGMSYFTSVGSVAVYGGGDGNSYSAEKQALKAGVDVVIGTPGRLIAHSNMSYVDWSGLEFLVLDEADRMLDMGFYDDIMRIIKNLPKKRQSLLFSATMPDKMRQLARSLLHQPVEINIAVSRPADKIKQHAFVVYDTQKQTLIEHLLKEKNFKSVIVFCSTKSSVKELSKHLKKTSLKVQEIHSDLEQAQREDILNQFKSRTIQILVATDILSRGIDVEDIDLVVNYDVPPDGEDYIHRIGRTARAESDGLAYTLINEKDQNRFAGIEKLLGHSVEKTPLPESIGEGPQYNPQHKNQKKRRRHSGKGNKQFNRKAN
ncbi:MAG: DEAD/DEAH box helicase [Bacteroidales bacterium]|nr:DEAD/DEAH box helicase [Bacteroidales bacterium]